MYLDSAKHFFDGAELEDDLGEGERVLAVVFFVHLALKVLQPPHQPLFR